VRFQVIHQLSVSGGLISYTATIKSTTRVSKASTGTTSYISRTTPTGEGATRKASTGKTEIRIAGEGPVLPAKLETPTIEASTEG
jgi:hypothetical protein